MASDVSAKEVKKYSFKGKGYLFHAEYGGERCKLQNNLFQFVGLLKDRSEIISTDVADVEKKILKI